MVHVDHEIKDNQREREREKERERKRERVREISGYEVLKAD